MTSVAMNVKQGDVLVGAIVGHGQKTTLLTFLLRLNNNQMSQFVKICEERILDGGNT